MIIHFAIGACLVLMLLILSVLTRKMYKGSKNRIFFLLLSTSFIVTLFDCLSVYAENNKQVCGVLLPQIANTGYFLTYNFVPLCYLIYILSLTDTWHKIIKNKLLQLMLMLPYFLDVILLITNIWTHKIFYFDANGNYMRGEWFLLLTILGGISAIFGCVLIIKYRKSLNKPKIFSLLSLYMLVIGATIIQIYQPNLIITSFALALALLLIVVTIQRPEERIELTTGFETLNAYATDMRGVYITEKPAKEILIDIVNFSLISNILTYEAKSELLYIIARKLEGVNKSMKEKLVNFYYLGDGRFRIVFSNIKEEKINEYLQRLLELFRETFSVNSVDLNLKTYICFVDCLKDVDDFDSLYLFETYFVNVAGNENKVVFAADLVKNNKFKCSDNMNVRIEDALNKNKFEVYYQPIYSIKDKKFTSAEALIRWYDPEFGFISPELFIPMAEQTGLIHRIGIFVLEEVFKFINSEEYKSLGLDYIEINLSVAQCMQVDLADNIQSLMNKYNIKPTQINLEITETAANYSQAVMENNLEKLTAIGIGFSLDDYGTGYSNIKRITQLPLKIIKLDKTFANDIDNPKMKVILENTVKMIKDMNMKVVVEGVETETMLNTFTDLDCELIQGYYFSKPIPKESFVKFIKESLN